MHFLRLEKPVGKHRHQRAGKQVRRSHRKSDCKRKRNKKGSGRADHEEGRQEDSEDAQHRKQSRDRDLPACFQDRAGLRFALGQMHMNVFKKHRPFVHEHSYGKSKPAKSHDVNGLSRDPQSDHRYKQSKWDRDDDDQRTAPIAQKEKQRKAREDRAK